MAVGNLFSGLKNKVRALYNNFFYDGHEAPTPPIQEEYYGSQEQTGAQQPPQNYNTWQSAPYGGQAPYQQPYQQTSQQQPYAQGGYQQSYAQNGYGQQPYQQSAPQQPQPVQQPQAANQGRIRRTQHRMFTQKVVDIGDFQQKNQPEQQAQPAAAENDKPNLLSARVINARSMGDCRSAITLLRSGDAVLIVLENITDPTEMRRLVDTLSGACYSLTATITKVSRYGVYLLAPQSLAVYADQVTNQMNSAPARAQSRPYQPGMNAAPPQRASYTAPAQQQPQQNNPYAGMQGFTQRSAAPEEAPQNFYQRPMPQQAQTTGFSAQPAAYGYAPDEPSAAAQ